MAGRNILVTGGGGYLGGKVVAALARRRTEDPDGPVGTVVSLDLKDAPADDRIDGVEYVAADVRGPGVAEAVAAHAIDVVVHLAAIVDPGPDTPRELIYAVDVEGTENVLQACLAHGVGQIIVSSSGAAYGYHPDNPDWLTEDDPVRGNEAFAYSHHKRLVEEMLARYRDEHPELGQLVLRPGTILGQGVRNQITNLFEKRVVLAIQGSDSPFVFIWDEDVAAIILEGALTGKTGIYNLAGDGAMTMAEIARRLGKRLVSIPAGLIRAALAVLHPLGLSRYGPEQVAFLQYRPVLDNRRLKEEFGYTPKKTTREVFELYLADRAARREGNA